MVLCFLSKPPCFQFRNRFVEAAGLSCIIQQISKAVIALKLGENDLFDYVQPTKSYLSLTPTSHSILTIRLSRGQVIHALIMLAYI